MSAAVRVLKRSLLGDDCWLFQGCTVRGGYGQIRVGNRPNMRSVYAHRVVYEEMRGPIPEGLELDHLCFTPACVNPDHLEPVTHAENSRRRRGRYGRREAA